MLLASLFLMTASAAAAPTGEIRGIVVSEAEEPLASVQVSLGETAQPDGSAAVRLAARTGRDGRFLFENLPLGAYTLGLAKGGYEAGSRVSQSVALTEAEPEGELRIALRRSAAITGAVLDPDGDPAPNAVVAVHEWRTSFGLRTLRPIRLDRSDDRGGYRLHGLRPGRYLLSARPARLPAPAGVLAFDLRVVYYANAPSPQQADVTLLDWGQELAADLVLPWGADVAIEGVAFLPDSDVCSGCRISVADREGARLGEFAANDEGLFAIRGLEAGEYIVTAAGRPPKSFLGFERVQATAGDPARIGIALSRGESVRGRISGAIPAELQSASAKIGFRSVYGSGRGTHVVTPMSLGGSAEFELSRLFPGRYLVLAELPPQSYLASLRLGGQALPGGEIEIRAGQPLAGLELELAFDAASVAGRVVPPEGQALPSGLVALVPEDYGPGPLQRELLTSFQPADGTYKIANVPPGRYTLFAMAAQNGFDLGTPADLAYLRRHGRRITVRPKEQAVVDAPFPPASAALD